MLDSIDRKLLRYLQSEPDLGPSALAERAGVSPATAWRRLQRMEEKGVLRGWAMPIDWRAAGYEVEVSLRFTLDKTAPGALDAFLAAAREIPEVTEIQTFLGRVDVRLSLIARDIGHYRQLWRERILALPHVAEIEALMAVATVLEREALPL